MKGSVRETGQRQKQVGSLIASAAPHLGHDDPRQALRQLERPGGQLCDLALEHCRRWVLQGLLEFEAACTIPAKQASIESSVQFSYSSLFKVMAQQCQQSNRQSRGTAGHDRQRINQQQCRAPISSMPSCGWSKLSQSTKYEPSGRWPSMYANTSTLSRQQRSFISK